MERRVKETVLRREALCGGWRVWRDFAPRVYGTLSRLAISDEPPIPKPNIGSRLALAPRPRPLGVLEGERVRFVVDGVTAWLRVERVLDGGAKLIVTLLAVTSLCAEEDSSLALSVLREALHEHGAVESPPDPRVPSSVHVPSGLN